METAAGSRMVAGVIGVACVVGGAVIALRPFATVASLVLFVAAYLVISGIGDIAQANTTERPWDQRASGAGLIIAGVVAALWPDATVRVVALIAGLAMIIDGAVRFAPFEGDRDERAVARLRGGASIVLGVLAMVWPRATVLVIAILFGVRTLLFGVELLASAAVPDEGLASLLSHEDDPPEPRARVLDGVGALVVVLSLGAGLAVASVLLHDT